MNNIGGLERALDRIVHGEAAGIRSRGRVEGMEAPLTPAGPLPPRGSFSGWSPPVTGADVLAGKLPNGYSPAKKERRLYRIQLLGQPKAFYIGMVGDGNVRRRLRDHIRKYPALKATYDTDPKQIQVRVGRVLFPRAVDMKLLHFYELYLQMRERPMIYDPNTWTFEDFEEMWEEGNNRY